jgi:hypothetical protein
MKAVAAMVEIEGVADQLADRGPDHHRGHFDPANDDDHHRRDRERPDLR